MFFAWWTPPGRARQNERAKLQGERSLLGTGLGWLILAITLSAWFSVWARRYRKKREGEGQPKYNYVELGISFLKDLCSWYLAPCKSWLMDGVCILCSRSCSFHWRRQTSVSNFDKISISREQLQLVATARRRASARGSWARSSWLR